MYEGELDDFLMEDLQSLSPSVTCENSSSIRVTSTPHSTPSPTIRTLIPPVFTLTPPMTPLTVPMPASSFASSTQQNSKKRTTDKSDAIQNKILESLSTVQDVMATRNKVEHDRFDVATETIRTVMQFIRDSHQHIKEQLMEKK